MGTIKAKRRRQLLQRARIASGVSLFVSALTFGLTLRWSAHSALLFFATASFVSLSFIALFHFDRLYHTPLGLRQ